VGEGVEQGARDRAVVPAQHDVDGDHRQARQEQQGHQFLGGDEAGTLGIVGADRPVALQTGEEH